MKNQCRVLWGRLRKLLIFMGFLIGCLAVRFDFYYDLNDDTAIRDILSGRYTGVPSGYCIQMLYPLGWLIAAAYGAIREISWYGLFLCLCQFGVLALIGWRLMAVTKKAVWQLLLLLLEGLLALGIMGRELVIVQYSVTSAVCMAGALFWFMTTPAGCRASKYLRSNLPAILLVLLSFAIRTEVCLMLLPFLLLAGLSRWAAEEKIFTVSNFRKYLMVAASAALGMLVLLSLDGYAYRSAEWQSFRSFFDARTSLYDFYDLPDYESNYAFYQSIGLSKESYALLQNYNFSLDDSIDAGLLERIAEYQREQAGVSNSLYRLGGFVCKNSPKEALWLYKKHLLTLADGAKACLLLAAYLLYFLIASGRRKNGCIWRILSLFAIRSMLWLYLYMADRALQRVTTPLLIMELVLLCCWLLAEIRKQQEQDTRQGLYFIKITGVISLLMVCGLATTVINLENTGQEYEKRQEAAARWSALTSYCRENADAYYIIDVYTSTSYQGTPYADRLFEAADNGCRNYDICGGWVAKSPLTREKLRRYGINDLEDALLSGDVLFVAKPESDMDWLSAYYSFRGKTVQISSVAQVMDKDGVAAYEVYRLVNE